MYGIVPWVRARPARLLAVDICVAAAVFACALAGSQAGRPEQGVQVTIGAPGPGHPAHLTVWLVLVMLVTCAALPFRRRRPLPTLAVTTAGAACYLATVGSHPALLIAPMIVLHYTAETTDRRTALLRGLPVVAVLVGTLGLTRPTDWLSAETLAVSALTLLALAAGDAARSRRAILAEAEERARRAEHDRENEARRRVTEERLRIARDLHDQVGHHLALINVQAGVADYVLDEQPAQVRESLAHIRQASRAALDELKDTVGLLREAGDAAAPTEPTVGLSGLGELVESFRKSGLSIEHEVDGTVRALAPAADLTAFRVVQESLTNVCKHAAGARTCLRLSYRPAGLRIVVENEGDGSRPARAVPAGGCGHGIRGMRERVAIVGGSLSAGPRPGGGFRVSAMLPLAPEPEVVS
ncbi:histidine kinase [Streptomyces sp. RB6PN25]|uniref:histidine kinase n=1 Tax=Streptomyces humicola TaxID=2953240 RepID=A0ABT1PQ63_9ACTN|nr:histidine kinase [Streptomyces humicola]MCQ4079816.1 histidine kinase [Streptomyces humicola]